MSAGSLLALIIVFYLIAVVLAGVYTLFDLYRSGPESGSIPPTSAEMYSKAGAATSTDVLLSGKQWGLWQGRRLYCDPERPCNAWNPFLEDGHFLWRLEMALEEEQLSI